MVKIIGTLLSNPQLRYTPAGLPICSFRILTSNAEEHYVVCFEKLAENVVREDGWNLKDNSHVVIRGYFKTYEWKDRDGNKRETEELIVKKIKLIV